ncbi:MAG: alpha-hydroxy-acid oxidizing enzyme [Chloroflexi bacterium]|nr:alpha-hydroxy-acid oxidizing enzyme [Chloroflexota bacterium]|tara:strand:+ start:3230 stop:4450 length:1221 start_codon:yes stop_codon:yes gene_type:complete
MRIISTLRSVLRFKKFERDPVLRRLQSVANVSDLRTISKRRLPGGVFDYIDGAAEDELTLQRNSAAFQDVEFKPRVFRDVSSISLKSTLFGKELDFPLVMAPTGFGRIANSQGELAVARAADRAGIPYTLSTLGTRSIEEIAAVSQGRKWFQVYVWRDRELVREMLERAIAADFEAIQITVDTAITGRRERDVKHGFTLPPKIGLGTIVDGALHPGWTWDFITAEPISFANVNGQIVGDGSDPITLADYINSQFDPSLSWNDLEWFRSIWKGPIIIKGIQTVEDAKIAADMGIEGIALSNHGGRQLDGAPAPFELLESVVQSVGGDIEILCDGGVRRGSDIAKALALGANACMIGRAYLYGLGAGGERGVDFVLDHLREGLKRTMMLCGVASLSELRPELLRMRSK